MLQRSGRDIQTRAKSTLGENQDILTTHYTNVWEERGENRSWEREKKKVSYVTLYKWQKLGKRKKKVSYVTQCFAKKMSYFLYHWAYYLTRKTCNRIIVRWSPFLISITLRNTFFPQRTFMENGLIQMKTCKD